ncbi:hypothetical protein CPB85DRAFT_840134 [Mucidula mucida]|nr:hypothetical protein CPB85DRAFT_840134 [Mucidula mucida]
MAFIDNQHQLETRKLKRDIYALNRANEDLHSVNQQITIDFNCQRHEFTSQQIDLREREIDEHLELIGLSNSLKAIVGETSELVLSVNAMAARRVAIVISETPTPPSKKRKRTSDWTSLESEADNENGRGGTSSSAESFGGLGEWSGVIMPVASSSAITPSSANINGGPALTPSTPITRGKRRGRQSKKSLIDTNNLLERSLGDYPDDYVMESGTVVWGKVRSNPWYPGVVLFYEDIRRDKLSVPIPVSAKLAEKKLKIPYVPHFIIRFFDNNWACLPLSSLKMLGKIPELDRDMVALHSQFQGKWTGKRHAEIKTAFKRATYAIASESE